jgi:hypothetical protein
VKTKTGLDVEAKQEVALYLDGRAFTWAVSPRGRMENLDISKNKCRERAGGSSEIVFSSSLGSGGT